MAAREILLHATCTIGHERRTKISNRLRLHRGCNRAMTASAAFSRRFFLVEGRLPRALRISPGARLPRALLPARPSPEAPHPPGDGRALSSIGTRDDQSLVCPQRVLGRVLELVLRRSLLRFPPCWRGRKHGMALHWAGRTGRRTRAGPAGCRRGGDHRYSGRRVADGNRHPSAGLAGSTFESGIIVPARRLCRLHERRGPTTSPR
jgi:hypothetical protein